MKVMGRLDEGEWTRHVDLLLILLIGAFSVGTEGLGLSGAGGRCQGKLLVPLTAGEPTEGHLRRRSFVRVCSCLMFGLYG